MPDDLSQMSSRYYDPWARTSWLVAVSRSLGAGLKFADRADFVRGLEDIGITADLSRISRWESGQQQVSFRALRGYEEVLGLPVGSLVAANRQLVRGGELGSAKPEKVQFERRPDYTPDAIASGLLERVTSSGAALTGGEWLQLATELEHFPLVLLPKRLWAVVCDRLVNELARTGGVDQLRRFEALTSLLNHPTAQSHVLRSIGRWLTDPHVQVVTPMLLLLQHISDPAANMLVRKLIDSENTGLSRGALLVASAKLARGHLTDRVDLALLEQRAIRMLITQTGARAADLLDLTTHLPDESFARVLAAVREPVQRARMEQVRETCCLAPEDVARSVSRHLATQVQSMTPALYAAEPDVLLRKLIREALFHASGSRRQLAAHLLGLSPYGPAVADSCIALARSDSETLGDRAWEAVWLLGQATTRRTDMVDILSTDHPWTQRRALVALARSPISLSAAEAAACASAIGSDHDGVRRAALYAVGLQAPQHLPVVQRGQDSEVHWWHRVGPALRDDDSQAVRGASAS